MDSQVPISYAGRVEPVYGYDRVLFVLAVAVVVATYPLIFMGGLVTSHGAGMSVPDWPNSYGYNMFLFPPRLWIGGIFYEHLHRLKGTVVGMLAILLALWAWRHLFITLWRSPTALRTGKWPRTAPRVSPTLRWLSVAVLLGVIAQGVLGGMRVVMVELNLAIVHACTAQLFLCLAALTAMRASKWWLTARETIAAAMLPGRRAMTLAAVTTVVIFGQLVVGALMRHHDAGLAIPDLPLAYGKALPPVTVEGLTQANMERAWTYHLDKVSLAQVWLHFGHRAGAVLVCVAMAAMIFQVVRTLRHRRGLVRTAVFLGLLTTTQFFLGLATVYFRKPADVASAHVALGAMTLMSTVLMLSAAVRLYSARYTEAVAPADQPAAAQAPRRGAEAGTEHAAGVGTDRDARRAPAELVTT